MDLQECRTKLDEIDRQIVKLFEERMKICGNVAEYKIAVGKPVYDGEREKQKLSAVSSMAHGDYNQTAVQELFTQIMTISRRYQYGLMAWHGKQENLGYQQVEELPLEGVRVVYQGVEGAYSHGAALQFFGKDTELFHVQTFEEAMQQVQEGKADYAVLPIENSSAGAVIDNYDLQVKYTNHIVAETFVKVRHGLLGLKEAELSDIETVYSHPQALMQCSQFLHDQKQIRQVSLENTAVAAKNVVEDQDRTQAAIASEIAAKLYGLKVLRPAIQNSESNTTRFIILSSRPIYCKGASKVSITFELPHRSGTLYNILGHFIFNGVNMRMIESRPIPGRSWEYRFFVDIEGNLADAAIKNALNGVAAEAQNMRILGNY